MQGLESCSTGRMSTGTARDGPDAYAVTPYGLLLLFHVLEFVPDLIVEPRLALLPRIVVDG